MHTVIADWRVFLSPNLHKARRHHSVLSASRNMWVAGKKKEKKRKKKKKKRKGMGEERGKEGGGGGQKYYFARDRLFLFFCFLLIVWEFGDCLVRKSGVGVWVGVLADITPPLSPF